MITLTPAHRIWPDPNHPNLGVLYVPSSCETCGGPVFSDNITVHNINTHPTLRRIPRICTRPSDGYHSEETGMEVCDNCS